jgi:2-oxoglutarate dehydrogenase E2 component (dihydrolipoamide succinyltransferase)
MLLTLTVPALGDEKQTEILLNLWHVRPGSRVEEGEDVAELITDKAAFQLPAPAAGRVAELLADEGAEVKPGQALARLEVD